jgi:hypothetical protein
MIEVRLLHEIPNGDRVVLHKIDEEIPIKRCSSVSDILGLTLVKLANNYQHNEKFRIAIWRLNSSIQVPEAKLPATYF